MLTQAIEIDHRTVDQALRQMGKHPDAAMWSIEYVDHTPTQAEVRSVLATLGCKDPQAEDRRMVKEVMRAMKRGVDAEAARLVPSLTAALLEAFDVWMQPQIPNGGPSVHPTRLLRDACVALQWRWRERAENGAPST